MSITLLTGSGHTSDPWHDFEGAAAALSPLLATRGSVTVSDEVDATFARLPRARPDVLVLCVGDAGTSRRVPGMRARRGLSRYLESGGRMLALHSSATAFPHWPEWQRLLGGRWLPDESFHPPFGPATVHVQGGEPLEVDDERYTALLVDPAVEVLAWHEWQGQRHPLSWVHTVGRGLVVYDALGHEPASYSQPDRVRLLEVELDRLLERPRDPASGVSRAR